MPCTAHNSSQQSQPSGMQEQRTASKLLTSPAGAAPAPLYILSAQRLRSSQQDPRMPSWMWCSAALQAAAAPGADGISSVAQPCRSDMQR
jgi:hypothetical protein